MTLTPSRQARLEDRYAQHDGVVFLSGLQALVRLPMEQHRRDSRGGSSVATMISGYEGSPLAGFDLELQRQAELLAGHHVVVRPAVNEELAANIVQGSQLAHTVGRIKHDGVVGIWYGKAPGLDRATDALRHANLGGASRQGGAIALVGDDANAKSSTVPSASEAAIAELGMPVLVPADPQEVLELGLHAIALSRHSGLWAALKLATNVVDGTGLVDLDQVLALTTPQLAASGAEHKVSARFLQPSLGQLERSLAGRQALALEYIRASGINRVLGDPGGRIGFIASGITCRELLQSLTTLGLDAAALPTSGVRVLKLGAVWPLDREAVRAFAVGLDRLVVLEEKRQFVELMVKDALYDVEERPVVMGRYDSAGRPFLRADADLPAEVITAAISPMLVEALGLPGAPGRDEPGSAERARTLLPILSRTPYFCSGCPHSTSTRVPEGSLVGAGIGCSGLVSFMKPEQVGDVIGFTQMGGEGMTWVGMEPFLVDHDHFIQNIGDGTYHHSGSLAVRAAVAAGSRITYKILYNGAVAMTGGQHAEGRLEVPALCRELLAEGVKRVTVVTDDPRRHRRTGLPRRVEVRHRSELMQVQEELAAVPGVTVLVYEQECATELRRARKRGLAKTPETRVFINTRICEGCGDCGAKSNCLSVVPVDTEFGRKTQIHQGSCNLDFSCLQGDCPSFVTVKNGRRRRRETPEVSADELPTATRVLGRTVSVRLMGIGGTGVVTTAQILSTAAAHSGLHVTGLDQLGMAQKGGAVVSDIRIGPGAQLNRIAESGCDVYLGCDLLVAAAASNLAVIAPGVTSAVVATAASPTGAMVVDPDVAFPPRDQTVGRIADRVRADTSRFPDAHAITRGLFGDEQTANTFLLGVAVQCGLLPVTAEAVESAISLNGVAVPTNLQAFRRGRQWVVDPAKVEGLAGLQHVARAHAQLRRAEELVVGVEDDGLRLLLVSRAAELIAYQSEAYARLYVDRVAGVLAREGAALPGSSTVAHAFARQLFKLMAYKDEFEVARLALDPEFFRAVSDEFGPDATFSYELHPPVLRRLGVKRKIALGPWARPALRGLHAMRWLRGRPINPFGWGEVRRTERELPLEYVDAVLRAVDQLRPTSLAAVLEVAELPDMVRGYESLKMANVARYRARVGELLAELDPVAPAATPPAPIAFIG